MFLESSVEHDFPFFYEFVGRLVRRVTSRHKVYDAYVKKSGLSRHFAFSSLCFGTEPTILPSAFGCEPRGAGGASRISVGMTFSARKLGIATAIISRYEDAALMAFHKPDKSNAAKLLQWSDYLEATIVHEMVHWARKFRGVESDSYEKEESIAQAFEKEAYGKVITSPEELCFNQQTYTPSKD